MKFVKDIMTTDVLTVHTSQNLSDVRSLLRDNDIHHIPVLSGNKPVGVISSNDIHKLIFDVENTDDRMIDAMLDHQFSIEKVMNTDIKTVESTDKIKEATGILSTGSLHSVIAVDDNGELAGLVTSTDLIRHLHELL